MDNFYLEDWGKLIDLGMSYYITPADIFISSILTGKYENLREFKNHLDLEAKSESKDWSLRIEADIAMRLKLKKERLYRLTAHQLKIFESIWDDNICDQSKEK